MRKDRWAPRLIDWNALEYAGVAYWVEDPDGPEFGYGEWYLELDWEHARPMEAFDWVPGADPADHVTKCTVCGHQLRKFVALVDPITNEGIAVGYDCAQTHQEFLTYADAAIARVARKVEQRREEIKRQLHVAKWLANKPELAKAFEVDHHITQDIKTRLGKYGEITVKQEALVLKIAADVAERAVRAEEAGTFEAFEAAAKAAGFEAPTGRVVVTGVVLHTKWQDNDFGGTYKMLVGADEGYKVWTTVPAAIDPERGDRVQFTVTLEQAKDDKLMTFGKRPTKAEVIKTAV
jgi:hypothetical protein